MTTGYIAFLTSLKPVLYKKFKCRNGRSYFRRRIVVFTERADYKIVVFSQRTVDNRVIGAFIVTEAAPGALTYINNRLIVNPVYCALRTCFDAYFTPGTDIPLNYRFWLEGGSYNILVAIVNASRKNGVTEGFFGYFVP
jgi:hypothetical protein